MTNQIIDNNISDDIKKSILWQYDNAQKLVAIINLFSDYAEESTENLWDKYHDLISIFDNTAAQDDNFALSLWGIILGIPRPSWTDYSVTPNVTAPISNALYFKILKANFHLYNSRFSFRDIGDYLEELGLNELGYRAISDGSMSLKYELAEGYSYPDGETGYLMETGYFKKFPAAVEDNAQNLFIPGFQFGFREAYLAAMIKNYADSATWAVNDYCFYKRGIYKCVTAVESQEAFDDNKWTLVDAKLYDSSIPYAVGDKCKVGQKVFNCTTSIISTEAFNPSHWTQALAEYDNVTISSYDGIHFDKYVQVDFVGDIGAAIPLWKQDSNDPHKRLKIGALTLQDAGDGTGIGTGFYNVGDEDYEIGSITIDNFKKNGQSPSGIRFAYNMDIPRKAIKIYKVLFNGTGFPSQALYKNGLSHIPTPPYT